MSDSVFPSPAAPPLPRPAPVARVLHREPLRSICETLAISIHDIVNEPGARRVVAHLWRIGRRMEQEWWLRRELGSL